MSSKSILTSGVLASLSPELGEGDRGGAVSPLPPASPPLLPFTPFFFLRLLLRVLQVHAPDVGIAAAPGAEEQPLAVRRPDRIAVAARIARDVDWLAVFDIDREHIGERTRRVRLRAVVGDP